MTAAIRQTSPLTAPELLRRLGTTASDYLPWILWEQGVAGSNPAAPISESGVSGRDKSLGTKQGLSAPHPSEMEEGS